MLIQATKKRLSAWEKWNERQLDEVWQSSAYLVLILPFHKELMNDIKMSKFNLHLNLLYRSVLLSCFLFVMFHVLFSLSDSFFFFNLEITLTGRVERRD